MNNMICLRMRSIMDDREKQIIDATYNSALLIITHNYRGIHHMEDDGVLEATGDIVNERKNVCWNINN